MKGYHKLPKPEATQEISRQATCRNCNNIWQETFILQPSAIVNSKSYDACDNCIDSINDEENDYL